MDSCRHLMKMHPAKDHSVLNPQMWLCQTCGTTENVWVILDLATSHEIMKDVTENLVYSVQWNRKSDCQTDMISYSIYQALPSTF